MSFQSQWDALEAAGALNSSQWPSWATWDKLDPKIKEDKLACGKCGTAVAEKGNPMQTFRCKNVSCLILPYLRITLPLSMAWANTQ